jgi:hypothetical protein
MRFLLPHDESEFEIPDACWQASGAAGYVRTESAFAALPGVKKLWEQLTSRSGETIQSIHCPTQVVPLIYVAPPGRELAPSGPVAGTPGFDEMRMTRVLQAICSGVALPPIEVWRGFPGEVRFSPRDGFHRFYASVALGFTMLPVAVFRYVA